jgi:hypothetical protein
MEQAKKTKRKRKPLTEPYKSEASEPHGVEDFNLKPASYMNKPTFPKAPRFVPVAQTPVALKSDSPRQSIRSTTMLEQVSLSQMKANFAKELKQMIDNEVKAQE